MSRRRISELLSREEIAGLTKASNGRGLLSLSISYALIAGSFALVAWQPNALTIVAALVVLGGRQLALAVLMHECAHRSLFRFRWLNDVVGKWLCAAPIHNQLDGYRGHHMPHHNNTGTDGDPDLNLVTPFPTSRRSLARKVARDLLGLTGLKRSIGMLMMDAGIIAYTASGSAKRIAPGERGNVMLNLMRRTGPTVLFNGVLFTTLWLAGHPWLILLWAGAYLTTFSLFIRIRSMAEHVCTELSADPYANTRTTRASWLAKLTVAPHDVNFHLEHHLLMTVPHYRLRAMHQMLRGRGALDDCHIAGNYVEVLRLMAH
jgi:fatty acid desaturase